MTATRRRGWVGAAIVVAAAYASIGKLFALPAEHDSCGGLPLALGHLLPGASHRAPRAPH